MERAVEGIGENGKNPLTDDVHCGQRDNANQINHKSGSDPSLYPT